VLLAAVTLFGTTLRQIARARFHGLSQLAAEGGTAAAVVAGLALFGMFFVRWNELVGAIADFILLVLYLFGVCLLSLSRRAARRGASRAQFGQS
jgi:hypothetical protein